MTAAPWELEVVTPYGGGLWHGDELEAAGLGDGRAMFVLRGRQKVTAVVQTCEADAATGGVSVTQRGGLSRMWWASVVQLEIAPLGHGEVMTIPVIPISEADEAIVDAYVREHQQPRTGRPINDKGR